MFWRKDPRQGKSTYGDNPDWPRNGAILKGLVHEFAENYEESRHWLEVSEYKQSGSDSWVPTPGAWM